MTTAFPFALLVLCNEYKGDNISRLTVEPDLFPFDHFDTLVQHKFPVYTYPTILGDYEYTHFKKWVNVTKEIERVSNHEYFPIVSNLWYVIMLRFRNWNILKVYAERLTRRLQFYLNHTQIFQLEQLNKHLNISSAKRAVDDILENWQALAFVTLKKCNRSAMILFRNNAVLLHAKLVKRNVPAFLGKDRIVENLQGFHLKGQFPINMYLRIKYLFQLGTLDFWRKYFDYFTVLLTNTRLNDQKLKNVTYSRGTYTAAYVFLVIKGAGLLICLLVFLTECKNRIICIMYLKALNLLRATYSCKGFSIGRVLFELKNSKKMLLLSLCNKYLYAVARP